MFVFHPASQCPRGHCPFTLLHPTPFKQWHLLLHSLPKVPWSHSVIRKHSNNKNNLFVNVNKNCSHSIQNNTISVDPENIKINTWWPLVLSNIVRFEVVSSWNWWNRSSSLFKPPFHNYCTCPYSHYFDKGLNINNMYLYSVGYILSANDECFICL